MPLAIPGLEWVARATPLQPAGLVATGAGIAALLAQLRRRADSPDGLSAVATSGLLVLLGAAADLPWVDGARYCAPDPDASGLWLPTDVAPALCASLVQASLAGRTPANPLLLWHAPPCLLPLERPARLDAPLLDWLTEELG